MDATVRDWEAFKANVMLLAIERSQVLAWEKREKEKGLLATIRTLITDEERTPGLFQQDIKDAKAQIMCTLQEKLKGAVIQSRVDILERDEVPTKVFRGLERHRANNNRIDSVQLNGAVSSNEDEVAVLFENYYTVLFVQATGLRQPSTEFLKHIRTLTAKELVSGAGPISAKEIEKCDQKVATQQVS